MARVIWEVDFYSRPVVDEQGKKLWELLLCDRQGEVRIAQACPPDQINSRWLQEMLAPLVQQYGITHLRSFRAPMLPMLQRACEPLQVTVLPSRRVVALAHWLQERWRTVYRQMPGFQPLATPPPAAKVAPAPQPLPEPLRGQRWTWATLGWGDIRQGAAEWADFGELLPWQYIDLAPETPIPGLVVYSGRAATLAAWLSGLELAEIQGQDDTVCWLVGLEERWLFARKVAGVEVFAQQRQQAQGVHFLAVQSHPEAERLEGFWLLQSLALG